MIADLIAITTGNKNVITTSGSRCVFVFVFCFFVFLFICSLCLIYSKLFEIHLLFRFFEKQLRNEESRRRDGGSRREHAGEGEGSAPLARRALGQRGAAVKAALSSPNETRTKRFTLIRFGIFLF